MVGIVFFDIFTDQIDFLIAFCSIFIGVIIGIFTSRMFHLSWNHNAKQIVSRFDLFGGVIVSIYIVFAIFRNKIIELFVHGPIVGAISFAIIAGIMIGRFIGTRGKIIQILREQQVFK